MSSEISIRMAEARDAATLAQFNIAMAWETEQRELAPEIVSAGVKGVLKNPNLGFYLVAERENEIVGSLLVTPEWSDWRNGFYWWIQSVYVKPSFRRLGVYRRLYVHAKAKAVERGDVCGLRLYVERENRAAQIAYKRLGMAESHYAMFEETLSPPDHSRRTA